MWGKRAVDPVEQIVREALQARGIDFVEEEHPLAMRLDFYLVDYGVHVEVKQMFSARVADQMARVPNIIVVQGIDAALTFARLIKGNFL